MVSTAMKRMAFVLFLLVILLPWQSAAQGKLAITWATNDAAPFYILSGPLKHRGICDLILMEAITRLPSVDHKVLELPHSRIGKLMDAGENVCFPCMIHRNESTDRAHYSNPTAVYPPHALIVREAQRAQIIKQFGNPISLKTILESDKYLFGRHAGRRFGKILDPIFDASNKTDDIVNSNAQFSTISVLKLIELNRADYTIDYPPILKSYNLTEGGNLSLIPIKENFEFPVVGAVGCSAQAPNRFAKQAISKIHSVLPDILSSQEYQAGLQFWFEDIGPQYSRWYNELVVNHAIGATHE